MSSDKVETIDRGVESSCCMHRCRVTISSGAPSQSIKRGVRQHDDDGRYKNAISSFKVSKFLVTGDGVAILCVRERIRVHLAPICGVDALAKGSTKALVCPRLNCNRS